MNIVNFNSDLIVVIDMQLIKTDSQKNQNMSSF